MARKASPLVLLLALALVAPGVLSLASAAASLQHAPLVAMVPHARGSVTAAPGAATAASVTNLAYHGGPVQHAPKVFLVFWGWGAKNVAGQEIYGNDWAGEGPYLTSFFRGVGGSSWAATDDQYSDSSGHVTNPTGQLAGVWFDDSGPYDPTIRSATDWEAPQYLVQEAIRAEKHLGYSADADYFIAEPPGAQSYQAEAQKSLSYCAYHSRASDGLHTFSFTHFPYQPEMVGANTADCGQFSVNPGGCVGCTDSGVLDGVSIVAGHEYAEVVTDPLLTAWWDSQNGEENADKCAWQGLADTTLSTGTFAVQPLWSNAISGCTLAP